MGRRMDKSHQLILMNRIIWARIVGIRPHQLLYLEQFAGYGVRTMNSGTPQTCSTNRTRKAPGGRWTADDPHNGIGYRAETKGDVTMQPDARSWRMEAVQAHPLAELLECPSETGSLLNGAAQCIDFAAGDIVF